jgi:hypothetical protein
MKIHISDKRKISAVQEEFSERFPYLRLEFFSIPHNISKSSNVVATIIPHYKTIGESRKMHKNSTISITHGMKVSQLEKIFKDDFGLYVQVFRKSGRVWLETTMTDDWTLAEQNHQGEELSKYKGEKEKPFPAEDYGDLE